MDGDKTTKVLVTGASGYVATHCVQQLLAQNYHVRGTVRSLKNEKKIKPIRDIADNSPLLELVEADLEQAAGWDEVVEGCDYVLHVASPFPLEDDVTVIETAVNGTLNVLKACANSTAVKKVVLTSSCAAINEGHDDEDRIFDEDDWTIVESKKVQSYAVSKTEAELAAWDFVKTNKKHQFKLTVINPTFVVGPVLMDTAGSSITTVKKFLNNEVPAIPPLEMGMVDVRDVAKAHILAMERSESDGERILITCQTVAFSQMVKFIGREFRSQGYKSPFITAPYFLVWVWSFIDKEAAASLPRLNRKILFDNSKSKKLLGLEYCNIEDAVVDMCYSLIDRGMIPKKQGYKPRKA
ncbi:unnamed protein product [Bursaphelenchus okinawaensis]|uniref:NAD-dependent epimerase/dehydratase domain-containing protein n=1 Tax=Bursaphelenchus okinawaensis TaxID=465554 RepID=A0A811LR51_9BILA|nr:unnamed protein product [Bursaphelenchus okinawaensis]CAG9126393.1 unnamed protein product [Bursaphelenchus okinawaensis]